MRSCFCVSHGPNHRENDVNDHTFEIETFWKLLCSTACRSTGFREDSQENFLTANCQHLGLELSLAKTDNCFLL